MLLIEADEEEITTPCKIVLLFEFDGAVRTTGGRGGEERVGFDDPHSRQT